MQIKTFAMLALTFVLAWPISNISAQGGDNQPPKNWFHLDYSKDGYRGVSTDRLYSEFLKNRKSRTVIVAVIDSGVDWEHEDLDDVMWVNEDEIPNNGIDDDNNGYVDDIHGWNFIGGPNGNIDADNLEITRLYRKYHKMYGNVSSDANMNKKEKAEYARYMDLKEKYNSNRSKAKSKLDELGQQKEMALGALKAVKVALGDKKLTLKNVQAIEAGANQELAMGQQIIAAGLMEDPSLTFKSMKKEINEGIKGAENYYKGQYEHYYNADFDPRHIVGDNYNNQTQRVYGNNDYEGPDASHGTHVAGIIAAERNNGIGMDGVADNVRIMTVRAVPDGDERDKDVANAIRYAVDNGASIINMSFGKGFSWNKKVVDDAVKYAYKNDVLLVHAAGNDGKSNDVTDNFPCDQYDKAGLFSPKRAKNWLEVGALNWKKKENTPAPFSNYGKENIDLFAPGVKIYSTIPDNDYASFQGTSMASPVVAGVAALVRSYFPTLSATQVKEILMETAVPINETVKIPGEQSKQTPFSDLSVSGGTVNAYAAIKKAAQTKGKNKVKKTKAYKASMKASNMSDSKSTKKPKA